MKKSISQLNYSQANPDIGISRKFRGITATQNIDFNHQYISSISSIKPYPNPYFIYVTEIETSNEVSEPSMLPMVTEVDSIKNIDEFYAQFATFFPAVNSILIPKKSEYNLRHYVSKKLLKKIDKDVDVAIEKCLLFLSNLASTYYLKSIDGWKPLDSRILHQQSKKKDNTYIYTKIVEVLKQGTKKTGPMIEIMKNEKGTEKYSKGSSSKSYRYAETYLKAGLTEYFLSDDEILEKRMKDFYKDLSGANSCSISKHLINSYQYVDLPSKKDMLIEAKRLIKNGYVTNKGKKLTMRNKKSDSHWKDPEKRSFVEDNIELYQFLTLRGYMIPIKTDENNGGRVVDSFTLMPSWIRNMCKMNGNKLFECDYTALHPNIAISIYNGKEGYITHDRVAEELGVDRSVAKLEHLSFFNKKWEDMVKSPLFKYYSDKEPEMMENIFRSKSGSRFGHKVTSMDLFDFEVGIMTEVISRLSELGINVLYVYDALLCEEKYVYMVSMIMNSVASEKGVKTTTKV